MDGILTFTASNRLETLCDRLADLLLEPPEDPLSAELVVVQSRGMERWLRLELARPERLGICANIRFPFPNAFLADVVASLFPGRFDPSPYDRDALTWRILRLLPALRGEGRFDAVAGYLAKGDPEDDARQYHFARAVADTLDQYLLYRPDMILSWESGKEEDWQASLWRAVVRDVTEGARSPYDGEPVHRARLQRMTLQRLAGAGGTAGGLRFSRVCVFGVSVLPPFHLEVLTALSRYTGVHLFLLNPSSEYWSHVMNERRQARLMQREATAHPDREPLGARDLALENGNSLLASLGRLGATFFRMVMDHDPDSPSSFQEPGSDCVLHVIQSDILHLVDRGRSGDGAPAALRHRIAGADGSLVVHSCYSAMREAEVLHDFLLDLFERRPELSPADVLVMTPSIETYAPVLQAVLESAEGEGQRIPVTVSDRPVLTQSSLARTLLRILELPESRCAASEVLALIADPRIRECFGLGAADAELMGGWVREAGVRWGLDERHRALLGLPAERQNTWAAGLDRLLLGSVMAPGAAGEEGALFRGVLPLDGPEGSEAAVLGRFVELYGAIRRARELLSGRREAAAWPGVVREAFRALLGDSLGEEGEAESVEESLRALAASVRSSGGTVGASPLLGVGAIRAALQGGLEGERAAGRFLTGRLTICEMLPMRSIPAEVICLVGMNDGSFPRPSRRASFDLTAKAPRPGDRSVAEEDRYLFLETILSARSVLYVSYVGQSIRDNASIAPAVPVSLLLDYVEQACDAGDRPVRDRLVARHPLQPFSPRYFGPRAGAASSGLFTYSRRNAAAARALTTRPKVPRPFCPEPLGAPEQAESTVRFEDLLAFLRNPSRHFVRRRLGFSLEAPEAAAEDREPFVLSGLDRYRVEQELLGARIRGGETAGAVAHAGSALRAEGRLPHGTVGDLDLAEVAGGVETFWQAVERWRTGEPREHLRVTIPLQGGALEAVLPPVYPGCVLGFRWGKLRAVDRMHAWLIHLVSSASGLLSGSWVTVFLATDRSVQMEPVGEASDVLSRMLLRYREAWRRPLPFFPQSSLEYAERALGGDTRSALARARGVWEGSPWARGERDDPYFALCFDGVDALGEEFQGLALELYGECLAAQKTSGGSS